MRREFSKNTLFLRFICCGITLATFIFTIVPLRSYAGTACFNNLRKPSAKNDGGTKKIIKDLKEESEQKGGGNEEKAIIDQRPIWKEELSTKKKQLEPHEFVKEVVKDIKPGSRILSLGSGSGIDEMYLAKSGHSVVATDFVQSSIDALNVQIKNENIANLETKIQDITKPFDLPSESFDVVYSHLSLNFATDEEFTDTVREISRVLKPGGSLYLVVISVEDSNYGKGKEIGKDTFVRDTGKLFHFLSIEYLKEKFTDFEIENKDIVTGKKIFYPGDRPMRFIQLKAKKLPSKMLEKEKILLALESRNKENKSNFPADILKENKVLFDKLKALKMPIYSKQDEAIYVWDTDGLEEALQEQYAQGKNDEAMISIITIGSDGLPKLRLGKGGAILGLNYRKDRQKQWVRAMIDTAFKEFIMPAIAKYMRVFGMTQYIPELPQERVILEDIKVVNGLPEVLFKNGIKTVYVFDAEKREFIPAFRGGNENPFANEDLEFSSISMPVLLTDKQVEQFKPDIAAQLEDGQYIGWFYGKVPEGLKQIPNNEYWRYVGLSTFPVAGAAVKKIAMAQPGTFGLTNLSVPDLNGHVSIKNLDKLGKLFIQQEDGIFIIKEGSGWDSALECLKIADTGIQMILKALEEKQGVLVLVGDHGSLDDMTQPNHSFNDVPIFIVDFKNKDVKLVKAKNNFKDTQADVAVTVLHVLGIDKPAEMTGKSLLPDDYVGSKDRIVWQVILDGFGHADFNDPKNAFGVAMKKGMMPTIKGLYDKNNYAILKACSWYAGLRGGRQEDFKEGEIIKTRDAVIEKIKGLSPKKIRITEYDYKDIGGASRTYDYKEALFELKNSPFLNDKEFVVRFDDKNDEVEVLCLDYLQMGSTEYNTWTLGAGRIVWQSVVAGDKLFISGADALNEGLKAYAKAAKEQGHAHITGILQEAAVHASARHLYHLIKYLKENGVERFVFDLASDGRDEGKNDALKRIRQLRGALKYFGIEDYVLNIRGREICFDRAKNWKLIEAWINELLYGSRRVPEIYRIGRNVRIDGGIEKIAKELKADVKEITDFFAANSRFFKAIGGETVFREYVENILLLYKLDEERFLSGGELALAVHSSFFKIGGAVDVLNEIIKMKSGAGKPFVKIGIYGEAAAKLKSLLGDSSDVVTAETAKKLIQEFKKKTINSREEIVILRPVGEKIDIDVKQVGFSERTISAVAVAKALQALTGIDVSGKYKNIGVMSAFEEFYKQMKDKRIISDETYENSKAQVSSDFDLPSIELALGLSITTKNDADLISKFIDSFI